MACFQWIIKLLTPLPERRGPMQRKVIEKPETPEIAVAEPAGPGFLFGFWKERYPNDDFKNQPDRNTVPAPGDMDHHNPHTFDDAPDQADVPLSTDPPGAAAGAPPKKNCSIM